MLDMMVQIAKPKGNKSTQNFRTFLETLLKIHRVQLKCILYKWYNLLYTFCVIALILPDLAFCILFKLASNISFLQIEL